jgi:hypothetical protein
MAEPVFPRHSDYRRTTILIKATLIKAKTVPCSQQKSRPFYLCGTPQRTDLFLAAREQHNQHRCRCLYHPRLSCPFIHVGTSVQHQQKVWHRNDKCNHNTITTSASSENDFISLSLSAIPANDDGRQCNPGSAIHGCDKNQSIRTTATR